MITKQKSKIQNIQLAPQGHMKIEWVKAHMPVLRSIEERFKKEQPFQGQNVAISLHLEAKTAYLAKVVQAGGANVTICGSNPLSTQDDICAALVEDGITVFARHNPSDEDYKQAFLDTLDTQPDLIIDDGGDLVTLLHTVRRELLSRVRGGAEETTTGIVRLKAMEKAGKLEFPMVAVNDAYCKYLFDNRYGTGQSVFDGINRTTNLVIAGKTVVVAGYGWCGKGVALRAKGLGAQVIVTEIDPVKAVEAYMDGFQVMKMAEAAKLGDVFITVTGNKHVIHGEHFKHMKDNAVMCNAGHFDIEIDKEQLLEASVKQKSARHNITCYEQKDGRKLYLLAEGRLVNLAAGDGHPVEIMDMTFALQALSLAYVHKHSDLAAKVYEVPYEIDQEVAKMKLQALGITMDALTSEQEEYLASWVE